MEVRTNHNRYVVCIYNRGPKVTHYLGTDGCSLATLSMPNAEFDREFKHVLHDKTPAQFAMAYTKNKEARKMVPVTGSALRVLNGILRGQPEDSAAFSTSTQLESHMAEEAPTFRKSDGPVAQVHLFLDKKLEVIKAGKVSRKELVDELVEKRGYSAGTVTTQCGVWARTNGISFPRPAQAAETKKAAKKTATKKTVRTSKKTATA